MTTVLVTGGAGYIGSHVCKALAAASFLPISFDNLARGHRSAVRWGPLVVGDLANPSQIADVVRQFNPCACVHLAAFAYVGESVSDPEKYYVNNVIGSLNLLRVLRHAGVAQIVFSSTCATYGIPEALPIAEDHPQRPVNPYGVTKLTVERALLDFDRAYGMRSVSLRYFNAAGADPDGEIGEDHDPETHAVPLAIQAALLHRPFAIYGTDYPTRDGTAVRDYIHVADLARAHVVALRYLMEGGASVALNLGTGHGHSVREVVETVQRVCGQLIEIRHEPRRIGDPPVLVARPAEAERLLGWRPMLSELDRIIETAAAWHRRHGTNS